MNSHTRLLCLFFSLVASAMMALGQAPTGSILKGLVTDPSGAAIPGASVTVSGPGGFVKVASSDADGKFTVAGIPGGKYTIRVSSTGFSLFEQTDFDIAAGKQISINAKLNIEASKQEITVTDTIAIDVDPSSNVGALVLKGEDLAMLSDNPDDLQNELNALAGPAAGPNGAQLFIDGFSGGRLPPKASIREIRVNSNPFSAEYDRIGFGRIEIFTKPGSDKFRGQFFYNAGNNIFNSRNNFAKTRPDAYQNSISGSISGPLTKKSSFALDVDTRINDEANLINALTLDTSFNPVPFVQNIGNPTRFLTISPRADFQLSAKHTLTTRYTFQRNTSANAGISTFTLPERAAEFEGKTQQVQATHTWLASARIINEDRFQFVDNRNDQTAKSVIPSINVIDAFNGGGATFSANFTNERRYEYSNITSFTYKTHLVKWGGRLRGVQQTDQNTNGYNGNFTFLNLNAFAITQRGLANGLTFDQIRAQGGGAQQFTVSAGIPRQSIDQVDAGLFIQDEWRVKPNLSLSTGLRFETQSNIRNQFNFAPRIGVAWGVGKSQGGRPPKTVLRAGAGLFFDRFGEDLSLDARRLNGIVQQQYVVSFPNFYPNIPPVSELQRFSRSGITRAVDPDLRNPYLAQANFGMERSLPRNITLGINYNHTVGINQGRSRNINTPLAGTYNPLNPSTAVYPFSAAAGNLYLYESTGRFVQDQLVINTNARINPKVSVFAFYTLGKARGNTDGFNTFPNDTYDLSQEWGRNRFDVRHRMFAAGSVTLPFKVSLSPFMVFSTGGPFNIVTGRDLYGDNQLNIHRPGIASGPGPGIIFYDGRYLDPNPKPGQQLLARNAGQAPGQFTLNLRLSRTWGFGGEPKGAEQDPMGMMMRAGGMGGGGSRGGSGGGPPMGGMMGGGGRGGPPPGIFGSQNKKYNLTLSIQAQNATNNVNLGAPVGTMTSPLFGVSNTTGGGFGPGGGGGSSANRRIQMSLRFSF
ncbi:MAG: TonB-dependent receptor [Acidobacteria bacterium]|nr:TonB-dependent receptor [Acidobacteriota bacterium]